MTGPHDHSTPNNPNDTDTTASDGPSLARMLATWQAWNGREVFARAAAQARAAGDDERAARLRDMTARDRDVAALDALSAQHEMSSLLAGWEWHTVRAAREQGATWADIAHATRTDPEQARGAYFDVIDRQEQAATRYGGVPFDDANEYRAAAGQWFEELHPDTPAHVVEEIEGAIVRDDVDELAALRGAWWNPHHTPPVPVADDVAAQDAAPSDVVAGAVAADAAGADRVLHTHVAVRNRGDLGIAIDASDAEVDALDAAQDAADRALQAEIEAEVAEADALYGPGAFDDLDPARVPHPAQFDDPWRTPGPAGNDLAGDVERVLAHLRVQNTDHERAGGRLWDMPAQHWDASIAALRAGGYEIHEVSTPTGQNDDIAADEAVYWLGHDPGRGQPGLSRTDDPPAQDLHATDPSEQPPRWWAQARGSDPDAPPVTFDESGYYSNAQIAAIGDALAAGDTEQAQQLQERPWLAQSATVDTAHAQVADDRAAQGDADEPVAWPVMPEWMRAHARRTEAEHADPAAPPVRPDDRAEITARVAELREHIAARDTETPMPSVAPLIVETSRDFGSTWQYGATVPDGWREDPGVAAAARATARHRLDDEHGEPGPGGGFSNWTHTRVAPERAGHDVLAAHDAEPPATVAECNRPAAPVPWCSLDDTEQQEQRREQLTRWHTDDTTDHSAVDATHDTADGNVAEAGPGDRFILVDGRDLP